MEKFNRIKNKRLYIGLLLVIFTAILFFITINELENNKLKLKIGDMAPTDIRATKNLEDLFTTQKLKEEAKNKVEARYRIAPSVQITTKNQIKEYLDLVRDAKTRQDLNINKKAEFVLANQKLGIDSEEAYISLRMDYTELNNFENNLMELINQIMGNGIKESELEYEKSNLESTFNSIEMKENERRLGIKLISVTLATNEFLDTVETQKRKNEEANKINMVELKEDEIIVRQGSLIQEREIELIRESGLLKEENKISIESSLGAIILVFIGILIVLQYIYLYNKEILFNNRIVILCVVVLVTIIVSKEIKVISPYIMPVATVPLLVSMIIDGKLAIVVNLFLTFYLGFILKLDSSMIVMYVISGSFASLMAVKNEQRYNIILSGFIVGIVNILSLFAFRLAKGMGLENSTPVFVYSLINGIISSMFTLGSLPLWENVFSVLTTLKLLELSNPNQPLLKRLLIEAPGTYHHSILVGNLSESAAESISANSLLARVGSYYHDIGKLTKPFYFAENQFGMENPHNKLQPLQSTKIILSHATDGISLAKAEKLPKEIVGIIEEHHGTTAVAYFYYKYKELNPEMEVSMDEFRYKGRKPQSKESAIVMMADSSEAAVRSIKEINKENIEKMVRNVVQGKLKDNQLDECNLTLKEIETIIQSFISVLTGIYHDRIEYPKVQEAEI